MARALDDLTIFSQSRVEGHHLGVDAGADAAVADLAVDGVGKVDGGRVLGQGDDLALGGEHEQLVGVQLGLERAHEVFGVLHAPFPVEHLADPGEALGEGGVVGALFFILPVGGNTEFRRLVHLVGADLYLERLAEVGDHRGVQRLVHVRLGGGDVVFDAAGDGLPALVDLAQHLVTLVYRADDDAHRRQVVDLVEGLVLRLHLFIDGIEVLGPAEHFPLDLAVGEDVFDLFDHEVDEVMPLVQLLMDVFHQKFVRFRLQIFEA